MFHMINFVIKYNDRLMSLDNSMIDLLICYKWKIMWDF